MGERRETSLEDAYLETALEERIGNAPPPDLTQQILSAAQRRRTSPESLPASRTPRRWQGLLVAAMLLVGAVINRGLNYLHLRRRERLAGSPEGRGASWVTRQSKP